MNPTSTPFKPSWQFTIFMLFYRIAWLLGLPLVMLYLLNKSRKESAYRTHLYERFGWGIVQFPKSIRPIWLHAASMGELKGITPLVQALLQQGNHMLITTLTPAGRLTAQQYFASVITTGQLQLVYAPLEIRSVVRQFVRCYQPQCVLMAEIDSWPVLLTTLKDCRIPLGFVNAQYPKKSFERDAAWGGVRRELFCIYDLIICKSSTHAARFAFAGNKNIHIAGETRFDLPIPAHQLNQANNLLKQIDDSSLNLSSSNNSNSLNNISFIPHAEESKYTGLARPIICFASVVAEEEVIFIRAMARITTQRLAHNLPKPLWIVVPRSPQRFDAFYQQLINIPFEISLNFDFLRRSSDFDEHLQLNIAKNTKSIENIDGILGDSLGEMYFYLQLSRVVVVGASFVPLGSHNVIEPIALKKPVIVGPSVWGIEYPGVEALAAGVLQQCADEDSLVNALLAHCNSDLQAHTAQVACEDFYNSHAGATQKHLILLQSWLSLNIENIA